MGNKKELSWQSYLEHKSVENWLLFMVICSIIGSAINVLLLTIISLVPVQMDYFALLLIMFGWINCGLLIKEYIAALRHTKINTLVFKLLYIFFGVNFIFNMTSISNSINAVLSSYSIGSYGYFSVVPKLQLGIVLFELLLTSIPIIIIIMVEMKVKSLAKVKSKQDVEEATVAKKVVAERQVPSPSEQVKPVVEPSQEKVETTFEEVSESTQESIEIEE